MTYFGSIRFELAKRRQMPRSLGVIILVLVCAFALLYAFVPLQAQAPYPIYEQPSFAQSQYREGLSSYYLLEPTNVFIGENTFYARALFDRIRTDLLYLRVPDAQLQLGVFVNYVQREHERALALPQSTFDQSSEQSQEPRDVGQEEVGETEQETVSEQPVQEEQESVEQPVREQEQREQPAESEPVSPPEQETLSTPQQTSQIEQDSSVFSLQTAQLFTRSIIIIPILILLQIASSLFSASLYSEKIQQRLLILKTIPLAFFWFVLGKVTVYATPVLLAIIATMWFGDALSWMVFVSFFIVSLVYFSYGFLVAGLAQSQKESSFYNVAGISLLTLIILVPTFVAPFSQLGDISPFTSIVSTANILSLIPFLFLAFVFLIVGSIVWSQETIIETTSLAKKFQLYKNTLTRPWGPVLFGLLVVPLVWLVQLLGIGIVLATSVSFLALVFVGSILEEFARNAILTQKKDAFLVALGFTFAEKFVLLLTISTYLQGFEFLILGGVIVPFLAHSFYGLLFLFFHKYIQSYGASCMITGIIHGFVNLLILGVLL
ncbi:MAG: hypothetical protein ACMXYF_00060 [Candidatus Woesearchaeota archaeon]